jgi:L-lactate dehydrogenase complex protein LldG
MKGSKAKEKILSKIRKALSNNEVPIPYPEVEHTSAQVILNVREYSLEEHFAKAFTELGGKFIYCADKEEFLEQLQLLADTLSWQSICVKDKTLLTICEQANLSFISKNEDLDKYTVGMSLCESLIARTGSIVVTSAQDYGRVLPVYPPIHIVVAYTSQLVWDWQDGLAKLKGKYGKKLPSLISLTAGPSRTADIEKTLVIGVHGPKDVYTFLIDQ